MELLIIFLLLAIGVSFLLMEIFFLPGIGVGAIGSIIFAGGSYWYGYSMFGWVGCAYITLIGIVLFLIGLWLIHHFRTLDRIALDADVDSTVGPQLSTKVSVGDSAISLSRLAPMGQAKFGDEVLEVKSQDGYIEPNTSLKVVAVSDVITVVKK